MTQLVKYFRPDQTAQVMLSEIKEAHFIRQLVVD
jgi:hypothetical protein